MRLAPKGLAVMAKPKRQKRSDEQWDKFLHVFVARAWTTHTPTTAGPDHISERNFHLRHETPPSLTDTVLQVRRKLLLLLVMVQLVDGHLGRHAI